MIGQTLSHFRITAKLGEGGMGEVYRAEDTKLGRGVAIKVLPAALTEDAERLARFEREAKVLASLNHPNIAGIYEVGKDGGVHFLAMELAPGIDLADRLGEGAISLEEALPVALQIATGLEAAHERGIVHRDLKPANIKITPAGGVKILDFGLAKAWDDSPGVEGSMSMSPTLTARMTQAGTLLGTAAYMSPEQARGRDAGPQADVWAFGVVLREMITGRRAFDGETVSDVLAAVLRAELDDTELPEAAPPALRRLLSRCLEREPSRRLHSMADARLELLDAAHELTAQPEASGTRRAATPPMRLLPVIGGIAIALVAGLMIGPRLLPGPSPSVQPTRYFDLVPEGVQLKRGNVQISRDGSFVVFASSSPGRLYLRSFDAPVAVELPGTQGAIGPFFSPEGDRIGFFQDGQLKTMPRAGGPSTVVCDTEQRVYPPAAWADDGVIYFTQSLDTYPSLFRVDSRGGRAESAVPLADEEGIRRVDLPPLRVPGHGEIIFTTFQGTSVAGPYAGRIVALDPRDGVEREILSGGNVQAVLASGHLAYATSPRVLAIVPFDLESLAVTGPPVVQRDTYRMEFATGLRVSDTGTLVYEPFAEVRDTLAWRNPAGTEEPLDFDLGRIEFAKLSPSGDRLAYSTAEKADQVQTISVLDFERGIVVPLWKGPATVGLSWAADGRSVLIAALEQGKSVITRLMADESAPPEALFDAGTVFTNVTSVSPDGAWVVTNQWNVETDDHYDIMLFPLRGSGEPSIFAGTTANEGWLSQFSPDGRWIAFTSNRSGRREIYVQEFPETGAAVRVSVSGGQFAQWEPDGDTPTLYYTGIATTSDPTSIMYRVEFPGGDLRRMTRPEIQFVQDVNSVLHPRPGSDQWLVIGKASRAVERLKVATNWFAEIEEMF